MKIETEIKAREKHLDPIYHQAAVHFADLHDTPERMLEKSCISEIVAWRKARTFFFWRLKRRLLEEKVKGVILQTQPSLQVTMQKLDHFAIYYFYAAITNLIKSIFLFYIFQQVRAVDAMLRRWFVEDKGATESYLWDRDDSAACWLEMQLENENSVVSRNVACVRMDAVVSKIKSSLEICPEVRLNAVLEIVHRLTASERSELLRTVNQLENQGTSGQEQHNDSNVSS